MGLEGFPKERKKKRVVTIGKVSIGGDHPIAVQSMTKTRTEDSEATLNEIRRLAEAGCEIVRVALPNLKCLAAFDRVCKESPLSVVADVQFDPELALAAIRCKCSKVRINPGNLTENSFLRILEAAGERDIPVRIGLNSGSLPQEWIRRFGGNQAKALIALCERYVSIAEKEGFFDLVLSLKSSHAATTWQAYLEAADRFPYPLHLGVTEAGSESYGKLKTAAVLGGLLLEGIGDTIRFSLTGDPVREVQAAYDLLKATGRRQTTPEIIACPSCARAQIDVEALVKEIEGEIGSLKSPIRIAVCGCAVNGPGEAREADIGVTGVKGQAVFFRHGKVFKKVPQVNLTKELVEEIKRLSS